MRIAALIVETATGSGKYVTLGNPTSAIHDIKARLKAFPKGTQRAYILSTSGTLKRRSVSWSPESQPVPRRRGRPRKSDSAAAATS